MEEALNLDSLLAEAGVTTLLTDCVASALPLTSFTLTLCMVFWCFSSPANASDLQSARRLSAVAQRFAHSLDTHFAIHASLPAAPLSSPPATCGPSSSLSSPPDPALFTTQSFRPQDTRLPLDAPSILIETLHTDTPSVCAAQLTTLALHCPDPITSLPSALVHAASFPSDPSFFFSSSSPQPVDFSLPLVDPAAPTLAFFSLEHALGSTLFLQKPDKRVVAVRCTTDTVVLHASSDALRVIQAYGDDPSAWNYIELIPYSTAEVRSTPAGGAQTDGEKTREDCVKQAILSGESTLFCAPTAAGKTASITSYCQRAMLRLVTLECHEDLSAESLLGDGALREAFVKGCVLLLENVDRLAEDALCSLLAVLQNRSLACESDGLSFSREPHPCFRVLATTCNTPSPRLRSVFRVVDEQSFPAIDMAETAMLLSGAFSKERVQAACNACKQHCGTPTIRDVRHVLEITTVLCQQSKKSWNDSLSHCLHLFFNTGTPLPLPPLPITFTSDRLDTRLFTELSSCVDAARVSSCPLLLVSASRYTTQKYVQACLGDSFDWVDCSAATTPATLLGGYRLQEAGSQPQPTLQYCDSDLHRVVTCSGTAVLFSIDHASAVLSCINGLLDQSQADRQHPSLVVATTTPDGLNTLPSSVRTRFLVVPLTEDPTRLSEPALAPSLASAAAWSDIASLLQQTPMEFEERRGARNALWFFQQFLQLPPSPELLQAVRSGDYSRIPQLSPFAAVSQHLELLALNRVTALFELAASEVVMGVRAVLKNAFIAKKVVSLSVSKETTLASLLGFGDVSGREHSGVLQKALQKQKLVVFENAETMSTELLEGVCSLFSPCSPYVRAQEACLSLRCLLLFHAPKRVLPDFVKCVECPRLSEEAVEKLPKTEVCQELVEFVEKRALSLDEVMVVDRVVQHSLRNLILGKDVDVEKRQREEQLLVVACLFAERNALHGVVESVTERWKQKGFVDSDAAQGVSVTLHTGIITITDNKGAAKMARGKKEYQSSVSYAELSQACDAVKCAVFTACIAGYKRHTPGIPLLCVGDEAVTEEVCRLLEPKAIDVDVTPAATLSDVLLDGCSLPTAEAKRPANHDGVLTREPSAGEASALVFRPGPLGWPFLLEPPGPIHLHNPHLAAEPLRSQLRAMLSNPEGVCLNWPEGEGNDLESGTVLLSCSAKDLPQLARMTQPERFIQVFCKEQRREDPLLQRLQAVFSLRVDIEPLVQFLRATACRRRELQAELAERSETDPWRQLLAGEAPSVQTLQHLVVPDTLKGIEAVFAGSSALQAEPTTIQMALALAMGLAAGTPVVLESAEAVGKTTVVRRFLQARGDKFKYLRLTPTTTVRSLFGSVGSSGSIGSPNALNAEEKGELLKVEEKVVVLDNVSDAPMAVRTWLATFLQCAAKPTAKTALPFAPPKDVCFILCSRGHVLPDSLYDGALLFRDITLSPREKASIAAKSLGAKTRAMELCAGEPDFLAKIRVVKEMCVKDPSKLFAALWLVFGCGHSAAMCERLGKELPFFPPLADNAHTTRFSYAVSSCLQLQDVLMVVDDSCAWRAALPIPSGKKMREVIVHRALFPEMILDAQNPDGVFWKAMRYGDWLVFEHCEHANDELMAFFRLLCDVPLATMSGENETPFNASFRVVFHCTSPLPLPCAAIRFDALVSCHPTANPDLSVFSGSTAHSRPFSGESGVFPREPSLAHNPSGLTSRESGVFSGNSSVCSHDSKSIGAKRDSLRMPPSIRGTMVSSAEQFAMNVVQGWSMDGLFQLAVQRSEKKEYVRPIASVTRMLLKEHQVSVDPAFLQYTISLAAQTLTAMLASAPFTAPVSAVTVIVDTNVTIRGSKARERTLAVAAFLLMLRALAVPVNLFVACGRTSAMRMENADTLSVPSLLHFVLDLETVAHLPSTPLDLLQSLPSETRTQPVLVFGDGVSEQLLSPVEDVKELARTWRLFLVCVSGSGEESLSNENQQLMEARLRDNFGERVLMLSQAADLPQFPKILANAVFSSHSPTAALADAPFEPVNEQGSNVVPEVPYDPVCCAQRHIAQTSELSASATVAPIPAARLLLSYEPPSTQTSLHFFEAFANSDLAAGLALGLARTFFPVNAFVPSLAAMGTFVQPSAYHHFQHQPASDGKVFSSVCFSARRYACSVVLDASSLAFAYGNRHHALTTLLSLLRALASLDLPTVDLWVASHNIMRVATGIQSRDLWRPNVLAALLAAAANPPLVTLLERTLLYAASTCVCRADPAVVLVLTNGVLAEETRKGVQSVIHSFSTNRADLQFVGVGLGLHLHGTQDVLPQFFWSADVAQLGTVLCEQEDSVKEVNGVKETKAKLTESYPVCHKGCIGYMKECKTSYVEDGDITNAVKAKEKEKQPKRTVVRGEVEVEEQKPLMFTTKIKTIDENPTFLKPAPPVPVKRVELPVREKPVSITKENTRLESVADTTQSSKSGKKRGCCPIM